MTAFDDLPLLRAFVAIVEGGSISAGARRLRLPQPTLSRYLRTLEERSGSALLQRDTHRMSLTGTGQRLLADAYTLLAQADQAQEHLHEDQTTLRGHLRLFATIDWGQFVVTQLVSAFLQAHPQVTAALALTNRPLRMIEEGCDVGVLVGEITDENVVAKRVGSFSLHLAAAPELVARRTRARQPVDLKDWPWLSLSGAQFWKSDEVTLFTRTGSSSSFSIQPILLSEGVTSIREAARAGLGIAILPDWLIEEELHSGSLVRVLPAWSTAELPVHLVYASQRLLPTRVRTFIDFAAQHLARKLQHMREGKPARSGGTKPLH